MKNKMNLTKILKASALLIPLSLTTACSYVKPFLKATLHAGTSISSNGERENYFGTNAKVGLVMGNDEKAVDQTKSQIKGDSSTEYSSGAVGVEVNIGTKGDLVSQGYENPATR